MYDTCHQICLNSVGAHETQNDPGIIEISFYRNKISTQCFQSPPKTPKLTQTKFGVVIPIFACGLCGWVCMCHVTLITVLDLETSTSGFIFSSLMQKHVFFCFFKKIVFSKKIFKNSIFWVAEFTRPTYILKKKYF